MTLAIAGCRGEPSTDTPIVPIRNMYDQPRYNAQERSDFFQDGRAMRPLVAGTIAREMELDTAVGEGMGADGFWVSTIPQSIVQEAGGMEPLLARGRERYDIYCTPCHGHTGDGEGLIARRGTALGFAAIKPPTFHDDRIRTMPDGQMFATITRGLRNMPAYRANIPMRDRWAIIGYVRALQISQASQPTAMRTEGAQ